MANYDPLQTATNRNKKYSTIIDDVLESIIFDLGHAYISTVNDTYYITDYKGSVILYTTIDDGVRRWQLAYPDITSYSYPRLPEKINMTVDEVEVTATLLTEDLILQKLLLLPSRVMP
ncbi:hypothetical protein AB7W15_20400 [Morganella morganii]|uniref:hypothetical protein n=1 Tax=Morganella morganii TaxID=582 RepID=UPI0034E39B00